MQQTRWLKGLQSVFSLLRRLRVFVAMKFPPGRHLSIADGSTVP